MAETIMKVETNDLKNSAKVLEQKKQEYNVKWQKIYTEIESLRVEWQGKSSDSFNKEIGEYKPAFEELAKVIESYTAFLNSSATSMEQVEDALTAASNKL